VPQKSTYFLDLPFETQADALRIGLANITPKPYQIDGICCSELTDRQPQSGLSYLTFSHSASDAVTVPGNAVNSTGATDVPAIMWSDWTPYRTVAASGRPRMRFRVFVPAQTLPMAHPGGTTNPGNFSLPSREHVVSEFFVEGDYMTGSDAGILNQRPTPHSPLFVIQYRARTPGIQIVIGGDSHLASWTTFGQLAALSLSTPELPVSVWNAAWSGKPSATFWPAMDDAIDAGRPSVSLIQGWTANDGMNPASDVAYLARVQESAQRTIAEGGIPIIVKGLPRNLHGSAELESWQTINNKLDRFVAGSLVFDPAAYVEDKKLPGNWLPEFSGDRVHASLRGDQELSGPFQRLLASVI